jgi:hypothetical protein
VLARLKRWWRSAAPPPSPTSPPQEPAQPADVHAFLSAPRIYGPIDPSRLAAMPEVLRRQAIASAESALAHQFNLLGSGPYRPVDPDRAPREGYVPIDWTLDPVAAARFPNTQPSAGCDIAAIRPPRADIKRPWELARCYHWVTLAQGWTLRRDERFVRELFRECDDFMEANPVGRGIQWTCTMDVAIRAANWVVALELVRDAPIDEAAWRGALDALLAHGRFIRGHLENHYEVTSNHFLSNVVGLLLLGLAFRHRDEGRGWIAFAQTALETEIQTQILPDGMDFESSVPYHRLVTELFFSGWRALDAAGTPLSGTYRDRLRDMHAFIAAVLRPDGLMPQAGDADDGRLHVFRGHDVQVPQDPRHLFGPAAGAFDRHEWLALAGPEAPWDALWWGLEVSARPFAVPAAQALFPDAGLAVHRDGAGTYLLVSNAGVGTKGFGNHKHNDLLSFEYHVGGRPLIVDPGSYVYTSDPDARNLMRSVVSHSSVAPEGAEPNEFKPEWLFRMFERATPEHVAYAAGDGAFHYTGRHRGFADAGLIVTRTFEWNPGRLSLHDVVEGSRDAELTLVWRFQLAPDVRGALDAQDCLLRSGDVCVRLACPRDLVVAVEAGSFSPSYGVRVPSTQIVCRAATVMPGRRDWTITLTAASPLR